VTARKPLVPAELRELLGLMRDLTERLPTPAKDSDGLAAAGEWDQRRDLADTRKVRLAVVLEELVGQLEMADEYPSVGGEYLARYCQRAADRLRGYLAEPLGYEPAPDREAGQ
jgi:hypothetical protein